MSNAEDRLLDDRRTRKAARAVFDAGLSQVKSDLGARSIPGRIADKARHEATEAVATGLEVASESKGIIAAVIGAIGLWTFRAPVLRWLRSFQSDNQAEVQDEPSMATDHDIEQGI